MGGEKFLIDGNEPLEWSFKNIAIILFTIFLTISCLYLYTKYQQFRKEQAIREEEEHFVGKWVNTHGSTTYYEFKNDHSLLLHITETGLNKKYFPTGENETIFRGTWQRNKQNRYLLNVIMNQSNIKWFVEVKSDTMTASYVGWGQDGPYDIGWDHFEKQCDLKKMISR